MANRLHRFLAGAGGRALVAVPLVGALVIGGYMLAEGNGGEPVPQAAPVNPAGGGAVPAGPSTLRETAPVEAVTPAAAPNELDVWVSRLAGPLDIPAQALAAYASGELKLREERPGCHLTWVTLAGMGKADGDHRDSSVDGAVAAGRKLCGKGVDLDTGWWKAVGAYHGGGDAELFRQKALANAQLYATLSLNPELATAPATRATRFALDQIGLPYVWGGNGPEAGAAGFDCSGLTKAAYDSAGLNLPRTADSQFRALGASAKEPSLGDLVFYGNPATRIHHVGMYVGNGLMVNAPTEGQAIQLHSYRTRGDDYAGAARP
ncbi:C40 family peptidase [Saccharothrix sp. AJ9571]|nr:C40 family peptidase [Saccharothrix sp. AJ9571]